LRTVDRKRRKRKKSLTQENEERGKRKYIEGTVVRKEKEIGWMLRRVFEKSESDFCNDNTNRKK
jgi:hypothetical protein